MRNKSNGKVGNEAESENGCMILYLAKYNKQMPKLLRSIMKLPTHTHVHVHNYNQQLQYSNILFLVIQIHVL